ncbi:MAG: imidazoleglycerol-phosphate dehydratase HisB [Planctomycetota bacterium]|nr:imidazoleglycerol-phosphate dehydratase HisB [Planctomycetota bacterium]
MNEPRIAIIERKTRETDIRVELSLDGTGTSNITTGLGFLDHMLVAFTLHARLDLTLNCQGDLEVDDHHCVEDCAIVLGLALDQALGDRKGIVRYGDQLLPMDESLARAAIDVSGRPFAIVNLNLTRETLGQVSCENLPHFFQTFTTNARLTLHLDVLKGENDHHKTEAAFKACARALRKAIAFDTSPILPSTKGVLA